MNRDPALQYGDDREAGSRLNSNLVSVYAAMRRRAKRAAIADGHSKAIHVAEGTA
jgi:hypothetical protein